MSIDKAFDPRQLSHLDQQLRKLVDEEYDLCLFKCAEKASTPQGPCKQSCFKNVIVPYRFKSHMSRDEEENLYRKCLSEKFPNIKQTDYIACTQTLYKDRVEVLSSYIGELAQKRLAELH